MRRTLFVKLTLCFILVVVSIFTILNTFGVSRLKASIIDDKQDALWKEAELISEQYVMDYYNNGELQFGNLRAQLLNVDAFLDTRIWLVKKDGSVQDDTRKVVNSKNYTNVNNLDKNYLSESYHDYTYFKGIFKEPMIGVVYPVFVDEPKGYILMFMSIDNIIMESTNYMNIINICFLLFLSMLVLVFVYLYFLTIHPAKKIVKAAKQYSDGHYDFPLTIKSHDEYRDMANSLTYMASEISNLDDYQKKFVANISHDFRSPLTSIKGYAEAILDGTIPVDMQGKYLGIILFETERLTKLTTSLLTLNSFQNNATLLDIVSFDINHIIKKTAESFEGLCTQKKITLKLVFSDKETFVDADMSKIQQVLYNLLDNAIKFSHHNSSIKVETTVKSDKVFVSVKDYGIGIPKESIKKVWERFYKSDSSRGKDKKGTGLGLSITKEIINSHNENINLISTEGVGTEFVFSLPKTEE